MEWKEATLGDVAEIVGGGTPSTKEDSYWDGNIPWITPRDLSNHNSIYIEKGERSITEEAVKNSSVRLLPKNSILFSSRAPIGYMAINRAPVTTNQGFKSLIPKEIIDYRFLYYWLLQNRTNIAAQGSGSTFAEISGSVMKNIKIKFPDSIEDQNKIAKILGDLDQKIELNRKMDKTLEEIGQALFRHYFIDNPDLAKWKLRSLGEFFPVTTGKRDANFSVINGEYPFFTCARTSLRSASYSFDAAALLLAGNGDFNLKYYRGKFEAYQRTYVLIPNKENMLGFLYFLMSYFLNKITSGHRGSVINFITKGMIENFKVYLPDDIKINEISRGFNQITLQIESNLLQNSKLIAIRDEILPKLMSGKISI